MKRMRHEKHGFTHAYTNVEEAALKASGWVDDVDPINLPEIASLEDKYLAKFGKRPHHRMKAESIKDALKE